MKENRAHSNPTTELAADFNLQQGMKRVKLSFNPQPQTECRNREENQRGSKDQMKKRNGDTKREVGTREGSMLRQKGWGELDLVSHSSS